ncbi:MAG: glycosyltransferase family 4 protein [Bacteroidales bacterium]|nr:MAG: glycosyltransferase family 4 protein [Bacteroidales bacterium]
MMKKILYFIQLPPPVHGVSTINQYITDSTYINEGFELHILPIRFSKTIEGLRRKRPVKIIKAIGLFLRLVYRIITIKPDLIYFSVMPVGLGFIRDLLYISVMKLVKAKLTFHLHNRGIAELSRKWIWWKLYRFAFSNVNLIHVSNGLFISEIEPLKLKDTKTFVVNNTIENFEPLDRDDRSGPLSLLFISNLLPEKGLNVLLQALILVLKEFKNFHLNVYGASWSKKEDKRILDFIRQNNLSDHVTINGPVYGNEKKEVLQNANIFIFPSYFKEECFPLSILEAMQVGLPIIATRIGAIPEMIEDGKEGIIIDPKDTGMLYSAIQTLIEDETLKEHLGKMAKMKFQKRFGMEHFEEKMRSVLLEAANIIT